MTGRAERTEVAMKWSTLIVALVLVIALVSVATAGSAWVLWNEYVKFEGQSTGESSVKFWDVINAFEDRQQCLAQAAKYMESVTTRYQNSSDAKLTTDEVGGRTRLHIHFHNHTEIVSALCLPDTLDPREKK
jgi:hypothetical protein